MAKKKNKQVIRPWCWYCEREFEDEKVLMQHQKAKHFKCNMCPRRLNTAGGLAVHIQQVHKLEPDNLPRIDNALPGRDGYDIEIFGMEGIPAPDVADYKRRKEIELGLAAGSISQPPAKRPKTENRLLSEDELRAQLEAHKKLMGASQADTAPAGEASSGAVYGAPAQAYTVPPSGPSPVPPPGYYPPQGISPPPGMLPGQPPFPLAGMPPGVPPAGFPPFPPGMIPPGAPMPPFPPFVQPSGAPIPPGMTPPFPPQGSPMPPFSAPPPRAMHQPAPSFVPASVVPTAPPSQAPSSNNASNNPSAAGPVLPVPELAQTLPEFKKPTELKYRDPNFSPDEWRAWAPTYRFDSTKGGVSNFVPEGDTESRGKKRARAEDFL